MNDLINLIVLLSFLLILDFFGLITLIKPISIPRDWKALFKFKSLLKNKKILISITLMSFGIILLINSFFFPWYYWHLIGWVVTPIRNFYIIDAKNLEDLLSTLIYSMYYIGLIILFTKITKKKKIHVFFILVSIELILIFLGIMFLINIKFYTCKDYFGFPEISCVNSGYSTGFYLYTIGFSFLALNGLQWSYYSWMKYKKIK